MSRIVSAEELLIAKIEGIREKQGMKAAIEEVLKMYEQSPTAYRSNQFEAVVKVVEATSGARSDTMERKTTQATDNTDKSILNIHAICGSEPLRNLQDVTNLVTLPKKCISAHVMSLNQHGLLLICPGWLQDWQTATQ